MKARNMLFIMSDEHNPRVLGCGGHPVIRTPTWATAAITSRWLWHALE